MAQLAATPTLDRTRLWQRASDDGRPVESPSIRIHVPIREEQRKQWRNRALSIQDTQPIARPVIRVQPIVKKPLQPYVMRESACAFLECRSSGRRCIASRGRTVGLGQQVAYCLGPRHSSCGIFSATVGNRRQRQVRRLLVAAAVIIMTVLAAAAMQALGTSPPVEVGRAVGIG